MDYIDKGRIVHSITLNGSDAVTEWLGRMQQLRRDKEQQEKT